MVELNRKVEIEAAQRTIRFFESVLRASADGLVITDASPKVVLVNEAFCGFLGKTMNEVRETGLDVWLEQLDTKAPSRWAELEERLHRDGLNHNAELEFLTPTGRRYFSVNASLVQRIANEERGVIISIWRETTESRRAAVQLGRYRDHLEKLVDEAKEREQRLDRISRVLAAIRRVDQLITQEKDRRCLLDGICQMLVETHEFTGAVIVLADERSWPPLLSGIHSSSLVPEAALLRWPSV